MTKRNLLFVVVGGALGAACRYGVDVVWGVTLTSYVRLLFINGIGTFVLGLWMTIDAPWKERWHPLIATGFLSSFTTMSAVHVHLLELTLDEPLLGLILFIFIFFIGFVSAMLGLVVGDWYKRRRSS